LIGGRKRKAGEMDKKGGERRGGRGDKKDMVFKCGIKGKGLNEKGENAKSNWGTTMGVY